MVKPIVDVDDAMMMKCSTVVEGTIGRNDEKIFTLLSLSRFLNCLTTFNIPKTKNKQQTATHISVNNKSQ